MEDTTRDCSTAVLLLHGLCANPLELQPVAKAARHAGHSVAVPLIEGYGTSWGRTSTQPSGAKHQPTHRFEQWIDDAERAYRDLSAEHDRIAVGGLCMGAVLALALAARVKPSALVLISPTMYFDGWNVSPWRRLLPLAFVPPLRQWLTFDEKPPYGLKNERLRRYIELSMQLNGVCAAGAATLPAARLYEASRLIRHVKQQLPVIDTPTQILHAVEDDVAGPRTVHELTRQLARTPAVRWFHDSYHMLTLDNEREAVCAAVTDFLAHAIPPGRMPQAMVG